jgi:hypothetical protein
MSRGLETEVSEMCNLSQGVWEKGVQSGMEKGMEKGIAALVAELQNFIGDPAAIAQSLVRRFGLPQEAAMEKVQQYWKN